MAGKKASCSCLERVFMYSESIELDGNLPAPQIDKARSHWWTIRVIFM